MELKVIASLKLVLLASLLADGQQQPTKQQLSSQQQQPQNNDQASSLVSVQTTSGLLNGIKESFTSNSVLKNGSIYKFLSVPYAKAPIGSLRFKKPIELTNGDGSNSNSDRLIDASQYGKTCPQYRHLTRFISPLLNIDYEHQTSEDCLHLNVFVPTTIGGLDKSQGNKLEPSKQLPVIVWLPGEGFDFADARQFDGSYLAIKTQSIVVTVQYRVGVLGFLNAPQLGITGNMGLHDQLAALKWIKKNIFNFGGDSHRITLMGRFSGSMSISALITAPNQDLIKTNDGQYLFNRVAMLSGIAVEDWIISSKQVNRVNDLQKQIAEQQHCSNGDNLLDCLQSMPVDELLKISQFGWRLVVDNELIGSIAPIDAIKANQFAPELESVLIGETGQEGTLCLYRHMLQSQDNNYAQIIDQDRLTTSHVYDIIRDDSLTYFGYNITNSNPIQAALESMVEQQQALRMVNDINNDLSGDKLRDNYLNACSAYMIKSHSNRFKRNLISRNEFSINRMNSNRKPIEIYHYELKYKPTFSLAPDYIKTAAHGDDIPLIFGLVYGQSPKDTNEIDLLMTRKMMAYIGNFVHGHNPLLSQQHQTINHSHNNINETTISSMDSEDMEQQQNDNQQLLLKKSWSSEGQINQIDFSDKDLIQSNKNTMLKHNNKNINADDNNSNEASLGPYLGSVNKPSFRIIIVERPQTSGLVAEQVAQKHNTASVDVKPKTIVDLLDSLQAGNPSAASIDSEGAAAFVTTSREAGQYETSAIQSTSTKSQRLLDLHRQQLLEQNLWSQQSLRKNQLIGSISQQKPNQPQMQHQQQQHLAASISSINESSFLTMLMLVACILIIILMSLCVGICCVILKYNWSQSTVKGIHQYTATTSSCNICDDSHSNSIDGVLGGTRKDCRGGFSNVFAKLRNHNNPLQQQPQQRPQCTSTSVVGGRQTPTSPDMVLLHQTKVVDSTTTNGLTNH